MVSLFPLMFILKLLADHQRKEWCIQTRGNLSVAETNVSPAISTIMLINQRHFLLVFLHNVLFIFWCAMLSKSKFFWEIVPFLTVFTQHQPHYEISQSTGLGKNRYNILSKTGPGFFAPFCFKKGSGPQEHCLVCQHNCMVTYSLMEMSISITTQSLQLPLTEKSNITGQRMITFLWHF